MGHTFSNILVHVIFATHQRRAAITEDIRTRLYEYLVGVARVEFGNAIKLGGTENHLHGLLSIRTDISVAEAMRKWKSLSSGWVHKTFPDAGDFAWQSGYGAFSVSESNAAKVAAYIEGQQSHHKVATFEEEYVAFLNRHNVKYDPAHLWD